MTLNEVLNKTVQFFKDKKLESARLDAELLMAYALKLQRVDLYLKFDKPLTEDEITLCREVVRRRSLGESVAVITGTKGFYGLEFEIDKNVLVPRPETESLVDEALDFLKSKAISAPRILDLGTGSGCIGLSILKSYPTAQLIAVDISSGAEKIFKRNQDKFALNSRSQFVLCDLNSERNLNNENNQQILLSELEGGFDCIVSNPPYIAENDPDVEPGVRQHEPAGALFAADQGLSCLKKWSKDFLPQLKQPGLMMFEMGCTQGAIMLDYFCSLDRTNKVSIVKDLAGLDRFIKVVR